VKIFIAGATGVLGRALVRQARARGHQVLGLTRGAEGERVLNSLGAEGRRADLFDAGSLARAAVGAEVIVHAATSIPLKSRPTPQDWETNDRIRREGTRALAACASQVGARLYIQQSIAWLARPPDGSPFDEDSEPHPDAVSLSALDGERIAREAGARARFGVAILRCGWFYGPDSAHTKMLGEGLARRKMPIIGRGDAVWSCLHTEDAAGAFLAAAEGGRQGLWHVVDDCPAKSGEFLNYFAERLGAAPPRRVPAWLARLVAGRYAVDFLTSSTQTSNARFRESFGWSPRYPSYREGIEQIVRAWGPKARA
jgi:nucleoside-diphosphate-sugar epimerase